jgi:type IV pilus assembly protein PilN
MVQINLLPWREQQRKERMKQLGIIVAFFVGLTIFVIFLLHIYLVAIIHHQKQRNTRLHAELVQEQQILDQLNQQKNKLAEIKKQLDFIYKLRDESYQSVRFLSELIKVVPAGISLQKLTRKGNTIILIGKADSDLEITLFMKSIEKSALFNQPILTEISIGKGTATQVGKYFQLSMTRENGPPHE